MSLFAVIVLSVWARHIAYSVVVFYMHCKYYKICICNVTYSGFVSLVGDRKGKLKDGVWKLLVKGYLT